MISTGLTSESVNRICSAVKKEVRSRNPGETSEDVAYAGVEGTFARERVCLKDDCPLCVIRGVRVCNDGDGDGGRLGRMGGEDGVPFFSFLGSRVLAVLFFLPLNGLKNDHSDWNCTESNSDDTGEVSSIAASSN